MEDCNRKTCMAYRIARLPMAGTPAVGAIGEPISDGRNGYTGRSSYAGANGHYEHAIRDSWCARVPAPGLVLLAPLGNLCPTGVASKPIGAAGLAPSSITSMPFGATRALERDDRSRRVRQCSRIRRSYRDNRSRRIHCSGWSCWCRQATHV